MKRFVIILAVVLVFSAVGLAYAQDPDMMGEGPGMEHGMMGSGMMGSGMMGSGMMGMGMMGGEHHLWKNLMGLGLDEKQKEAVKEIKHKTMKETIKKRADLQIAHIDLRDLLDKEHVDMNAVESKLKTMELLETDIRLSHIKAFEEIKATLTPDQRKKFREMMEKGPMIRGMGMMQGKGCGMMGGMKQRSEGGMMQMQHGDMEMTAPPSGTGEEKPEMEHGQ
jgi:Spy/CpxP family protein refolding chaperone